MMFVIFLEEGNYNSFLRYCLTHDTFARRAGQMEEEGVPSTALREVSLLQMLSNPLSSFVSKS